MKEKLLKIFLLAFLFRVVLAFLVWHPDVNNHIDWGIRFWEYGPAYFYKANVWSFTWPNQPPGSIYLFAGIRKLFEAVFAFFWWININIPPFPSNIMFFLEDRLYPALLKLPAILADLGIAYLIYRIFAKRRRPNLGFLGATIFLANPVVWYNSSVWGQTDAVVNFLALLAFVLLLEKRLMLAVGALLFSLYTKAPLLIFLPIFALIALKQKYEKKEIAKAVVLPLLLIGLFTLPFSQGEPYSWLFTLYKDKVFTQQLQVITANAFNLWVGLTGIHEQPHTLLLGPLTYQMWGFVLYVASYIPALFLVYKKRDFESLFWSLSIVSISSFMLLTNMHERYLYHFFPVFTIVAVVNRRLLAFYWIVSGISLVNLYNFWWVPRVKVFIEILSAQDRLLPRILGFANFGLFLWLYSTFFRRFKAVR